MNALRISIPASRAKAPELIQTLSRRLPPILLCLWVLTIPLEFTKQYFPNQVIELSRIVIVLSVLVLAAQVLIERREVRLPAGGSMVGVAVFIAYAAVSAVVTGSLQGEKTLLAMIAYMLMMLAVFNWTHTFADHVRLWSALAVSAIVISAVALVLHVTGRYIWDAPDRGILRVNATFADPNILARFLALCSVTMVFLAADLGSSRRQQALWLAAAAIATVALPYTYSRAGWVFALAVALAAIAVARHRGRASIFVAGVAVIFLVIAILDPSVLSRAAYLAENLESPFTNPVHLDQEPWLRFLDALPLDSVRHYLIGAGLIMFVQHPPFGIGFGSFSHALTGPYAYLVPQGFHTTASHTSTVSILAETGIVGMTIVLATAFSFLRSAARASKESALQRVLAWASILALLLIVLESQFSGRLFDEPYLWLFLGLAYSAMAGLQDEPGGATSPASPSRQPAS